MMLLVSLLVAFCFVLIVVSRSVSGFRLVGVFAKAVLVAVSSWVIWSVLLMGGVVQVDPLLRWLGVYRLDQPWAALLVLAPPIIVGVVFGLFASRRARSGRRGDADQER
jgi:hypothetical protein